MEEGGAVEVDRNTQIVRSDLSTDWRDDCATFVSSLAYTATSTSYPNSIPAAIVVIRATANTSSRQIGWYAAGSISPQYQMSPDICLTMRITEDGVWRHYNCPDPHWSEKCRRCREKIAEGKAPVEECVNCWKVEIWSLGAAMKAFRSRDLPPDGPSQLPTFAEEQGYLVGALMQRGLKVIAKASRAPILVVRTGTPLEAYPPEEIDYMLMLYAGSIAERDELRLEAEAVLGGSLPIRRGCWRYDDLLGPWETWYPPDKDWLQDDD